MWRGSDLIMAYEKIVWKNREVEKPRTFEVIENLDGTITLIPAEGQIIEAGTPIIAANMNNIEEGIKAVHDNLATHENKDASTSQKGHVQLATDAEVTTGTNTTKAVTPAGAKVELDKKVPTSRTINSKALTANITLAASDVGAVPTARTVNGKALSGNITLDASDVAPAVTALTANTTLALTNAGKVLTMSSTSARTITIPTNASVAFPIGTEIAIININTGALTITPASGVTLNSEGSKTKITKQYASAALKQTEANVWILAGNISS